MHNPLNLSALSALEQAAVPVCTMIDDFTALFAEHEHSQGDVPSRLKAMRGSHASSLQLLQRLQEVQRIMCGRIERFTQRVERFDSRISCIALNYGLNLLPDEVLSEIFVLSSTTLKEKVALSLVCRRFRSVMMSMQKMWNGYWIRSDQTPEENVAIAEANNFVPLKACIKSSHDAVYSVSMRGLDLDDREHRIRYYKYCVGLILSFVPEELEFGILGEWEWEEIEPVLAGGNMQNLRRLVIPFVPGNLTGAHFLGRWHMPLLRSLEVDFVPAPALGRNLIQFALNRPSSTIGEVHLREFLAAASSLQDLRLLLQWDSVFYEVCDLPLLRNLEVNFAPHPSLARHLVGFRLVLDEDLEVYLPEVLDFLSSLEALQELDIEGRFGLYGLSEGPGTTAALPIVNMPSVVSCNIQSYRSGATLIAKLRMPILRTLKLGALDLSALSTVTRDEFRTSLQSTASLEVLELNYARDDVFGGVLELLRYAPLHLDSLSLKGCHIFANEEGLSATPMPRRKLISFMDCKDIVPKFMPIFVKHLRAADLGRVRIQLSGCEGCRDGTFGLDDVMSARVGF